MSNISKGHADYFKLGDYNARCSICGAKFKASELVRNWQGLYRCLPCNEPRHPQDFVRGVQDIQTPPWAQIDEDTDLLICTLQNSSSVPGQAVAGCMTAGRPYIPIEGFP